MAKGVGSGIVICARDSAVPITGMVHIILPRVPQPVTAAALEAEKNEPHRAARFAESGVTMLFDELERQGALKDRIRVAVLGGAQPGGIHGATSGLPSLATAGSRNAAAVIRGLQARGLKLVAHDVGGICGRTCRLNARDGVLLVRRIGETTDERPLARLATNNAEGSAT